MPSYEAPNFQERAALAKLAKQKALDRLRAKPPVDPAVMAERQAARLKREEAEAEKRRAKRAAEEQAEADKLAEAERLAGEAVRSEAEKKAARDARYAARKNRK